MNHTANAASIDSTTKQAMPARILAVEDDANLLEGIRIILEIDGYEVYTAENGLEALEILRSAPVTPDLILSDIMMPHMNGTELLEVVRHEARWLSIPFIFLTARGEKADIHLAKEMGVEDYIVKPYDPVDLLIAIRSRLRRKEEIEALHNGAMTQMKRNILTILNHEFRTPLTFVVAYADMLNTPAPQQLGDSEMLSFLKGISSGADRLRSLIENFILLVELETGEARETFEWRKQPISDLQSLLEGVRAQVFEQEGVYHACEVHIADDMLPFLADEDYLKRAVVHLLNNAIKFSPAEQPVRLIASSEGDSVYIRVQDGGRGIPPEEMEQIWSSFYQVNRAFYEDQGAGSGLAIVRRVAELHGGEVLVESEVGVGSSFTMRLPAAQ
jgi:two-component system sensor histidine kinase/response regulator